MFCAHCGEELPVNAYFCLYCGVMTRKGIEAAVPSPWNWEKEVEKTLSTAAKEVKAAFRSMRESLRQTVQRPPVFCQRCGEQNLYASRFCFKCGTELNYENVSR